MKKIITALAILFSFLSVMNADIIDSTVATIQYGNQKTEYITVAQVQASIEAQKKTYGYSLTKEASLDTLIGAKLISQAARTDNFTVPEQAINLQLMNTYLQLQAKYNKQFTQAEFAQKIQEISGLNLEQYLSVIREQLLPIEYTKFKKKASFDKIPKPSEAQIQDYYLTNQKDYFVYENITVQHILFNVTADMTSAQKKAVQERAESVYKEIIGGKRSFEDAVQLYSEHVASKANKGTWAVFYRNDTNTRDILGASFFNQCFELGVNKVSTVLSSQIGYHIVKITNKNPSATLTLENETSPGSGKTVRSLISDKILSVSMQASFPAIYNELVLSLKNDPKTTLIIDSLALDQVNQ